MTDSTLKIARCPCGEVPERLVIQPDGGGKWASASGDCCGYWSIEFRANYKAPDSPECIALAARAWHDAPRGTP